MKDKSLEHSIVKTPYKSVLWTPQQIAEFQKCADPITGPEYFMSNYFYIQHPTRGKMLYKPFEYQKKLIDTYNSFRFSISLMPRQTGKSTSAAGYLLWYAMFVQDSTILIAAHKYTGAQEIMQRIRYAYELCPDHIRAGSTSYNKGSIDFENGSRIVSATTTETTGRGMSISLLYCLHGETTVRVRDTKTNEEKTIDLNDLYYTLRTPNQVVDNYVRNTRFQIATPTGWKKFKAITKTQNKSVLKINLADGNSVRSTSKHFFYSNGLKTPASELEAGEFIDIEGGSVEITSITRDGKAEVFDIVEVGDELHQFYVNGGIVTKNCDEFAFVRPSIAKEFWTSISPTLSTGGKAIITSTPNSDEDQFATIWKQANKTFDEFGNVTPLGINGFRAYRSSWDEHPDRDEVWKAEEIGRIGEERFRREHGCEFLIYDETLINSMTLIEMAGIDPVERQGQVRWYKKPDAHAMYVVALDPSLGTGGDPAAIQVLELPSLKQVAEWNHNKTPIQRQVQIMNDICAYLYETTGTDNSIYYSVENNTLGEAALMAIAQIGEENFRGIFLTEPSRPGVKRSRKGFGTTNKTKLAACAKFKSLVEQKKLHIASKSLISELKTFVAMGNSYEAKTGETDDLVMSMMLAVRMTQALQNFDADLDEQMNDATDYIDPMPFVMVSSQMHF